MESAKNVKSATQQRVERDSGHMYDISVLVLAFIVFFFSVFPDTRVLIGGSLQLVGTATASLGELVLEEHANLGQSSDEPKGFPFFWVLGLFSLASPFLIWRFSLISGIVTGMKRTVAETRELRA